MPEISQIIIGQPQAYLTDPHLWVDSRATLSIRFSIYESLVKYDSTGKIVPGLAKSWLLEEDNCTWNFYLRPEVVFHDGSPLTAADVVDSIRRACGPDMPGEYGTAALLAHYLEKAQISALDVDTVKIITHEPIADLLDLLIFIVVIPSASISNKNENVPGTGPYRILSSADGTVCLERFEWYWGGPAPVDRLIFKKISKEEDRIQAFIDHEVDLITYMPIRHSKAFKDCPSAFIIERSNPLCVILMLNSFQGPCADRRVRQALNYATNVEELIQRLYAGKATRLNGPLSHHHCGADPELAPYPYDPEQARRLLKDAGFPDGLTLTIDRPMISPDESADLVSLLKVQWREAGIQLVEQVHENREQYALMVRNKNIADLCVFDSSPMSTFRILREKLHSDYAGPWWEGYKSQEVNELMESAWAERDEVCRVQLYRRAYRIIQQDAPWVFLYNPMDMWVVRKSIPETLTGWGAGVDGLVLFGQGQG